MQIVELILVLLIAVAALMLIAQKINIPYPVLLTLGGLALGFIPGLPDVELEPELVFVLFLPPLLLAESFFTSPHDFRANLTPILMLAIGLVLATMTGVAFVAHSLIPNLPWAAAFALGAIVAPPDAVAVAAVTEHVPLPKRLTSILSGESLVNDATALVAFRTAIVAAVAATFSVRQVGLAFLLASVGGIVVGLLIGRLTAWVLRQIDEPPIAILITVLSAFAAYLLAEEFHASGVIAVVIEGFYLNQRFHLVTTADTRLQSATFWNILLFVLNGLVFILIGLQMRHMFEGLASYALSELALYAALVCATVILVRFVWVFLTASLAYVAFPKRRHFHISWREMTVISWAGARGIATLAIALSVPQMVEDGSPFPQRSLIIFLALSVLLVTLVPQSLSLPWMIRWLGVTDDEDTSFTITHVRLALAQAARRRLEEILREGRVSQEMTDRLRAFYNMRVTRLADRIAGQPSAQATHFNQHAPQLVREIIDAERDELNLLRSRGAVSIEVLNQAQHDLDLDEQRINRFVSTLPEASPETETDDDDEQAI